MGNRKEKENSRSITRNYIYNLIYQIISVFLPLVTTPYLSRILGPENIGIHSYTISIVTYFILLGSLGIGLYGQKEIAYVQNDKQARSRKFFEIFIFKSITMVISTTIFFFTFCLHGEYSGYYFILLFELLANILDVSWLFQGMEDFKKTVMRHIIVKISGLILIFMFVRTPNDLPIYFWIYVLTNVVGNLSLWTYLSRYIERVKISTLKIIPHIRPCIALFIPQVAIQIYIVLDKTMIGIIAPDISEVAYYEQTQKITKVLLSLITALGTVMLPRVASYYAKNEHEKISESINKSLRYALMMATPLCFGLIAIADSLIPLFLGSGFERAIAVMKVISPIVIFIAASNALGMQYLMPTGKERKFTICVIIGALTNIILNFLFIRLFGAVGAAIATVFAELSVVIAMVVATRKDFKYLDIFKNTLRYIICSIVMFLGCVIVQFIMGPSVFCMITQVFTGILIYGSFLIITRDQIFFSILSKIKARKHKV